MEFASLNFLPFRSKILWNLLCESLLRSPLAPRTPHTFWRTCPLSFVSFASCYILSEETVSINCPDYFHQTRRGRSYGHEGRVLHFSTSFHSFFYVVRIFCLLLHCRYYRTLLPWQAGSIFCKSWLSFHWRTPSFPSSSHIAQLHAFLWIWRIVSQATSSEFFQVLQPLFLRTQISILSRALMLKPSHL